jgi:hypothetical protein
MLSISPSPILDGGEASILGPQKVWRAEPRNMPIVFRAPQPAKKKSAGRGNEAVTKLIVATPTSEWITSEKPTSRYQSGVGECVGDLSLMEITADENGVYWD